MRRVPSISEAPAAACLPRGAATCLDDERSRVPATSDGASMTIDEFDLDRSVSRAWSEFRRRLSEALEALVGTDVLLVEAGPVVDGPDGAVPFAQILAAGESLQAELASNLFLAESFRLDDDAIAGLVAVGWKAPDSESPNYSITVDRAHTDRLSALVVAAFRDVWSVPHPTFLEAGSFNAALGITRDSVSTATSVDAVRADIQRVVDETLTRHLGELPRKDGDGDIPVRAGSALVFVSVLHDLPLVELKSPLVVDIEGRTRAAEIIADLNATWRQAKFVLIRDVVVLLLELPTEPFVPQHLVGALTYISSLADQLDDELARRLGGRLPFIDSSEVQPRLRAALSAGDSAPGAEDVSGDMAMNADLPPEIVSLLHLSDGQNRLSPTEVVEICGGDRQRILTLLRQCTEQEVSWRRSADDARVEGDVDAALVRDDEADMWQDLVELLRSALREILVRQHPEPPTNN